MDFWKKIIIPCGTKISAALQIIDNAGSQLALVVDNEMKLVGTLSDGDVRRALINGICLHEIVDVIINKKFVSAHIDTNEVNLRDLSYQSGIQKIPLLNDQGAVVGMFIQPEAKNKIQIENQVVIMAGGLGSRLKELTKNTPKPMLKIGKTPILEKLILNFAQQGFVNFLISVNYKSEQIKQYFNDGSSFNVNINYLDEEKKLGTAGPLSLLSKRPSEPVIVANADLITDLDFRDLLSHHYKTKSDATMAVVEYDMQVPYGVVLEKDGIIKEINEKPLYKFKVSGGIYVLSPSMIDLIPKDIFFDMPDLFKLILDNNFITSIFPINGYWLDIGKITDFDRAVTELKDD